MLENWDFPPAPRAGTSASPPPPPLPPEEIEEILETDFETFVGEPRPSASK
jgi:hypothetical protein